MTPELAFAIHMLNLKDIVIDYVKEGWEALKSGLFEYELNMHFLPHLVTIMMYAIIYNNLLHWHWLLILRHKMFQKLSWILFHEISLFQSFHTPSVQPKEGNFIFIFGIKFTQHSFLLSVLNLEGCESFNYTGKKNPLLEYIYCLCDEDKCCARQK